jgi:hypothetical protein
LPIEKWLLSKEQSDDGRSGIVVVVHPQHDILKPVSPSSLPPLDGCDRISCLVWKLINFHQLIDPTASEGTPASSLYLCQACTTPNVVQIQALSHRLMELVTSSG